MEFTLEKVKDLFNTGQFSGICKAAGSDHISLKLLPPDARVLIAHAHVYAGRSQVASALAQSLIQGKNSPAVTAHALIVSGLANKRDGHIDRAEADFRNALRLAKEERETTQLAWAHAHLFRLLAVAGYPQSHLTALLGDTRRYVSTSGDAHAMAYLHDSVATMEAQRDRSIALWLLRTAARVFVVLGSAAAFLAIVGLYGVKSYIVSRRTREFGVRQALGATPRNIVTQVLREGLALTAAGLVLGLGLGALLGRVLSVVLYQVSPFDGLSFAIASALLVSAALFAAWVPARRAAGIAPMAAIRAE